MVDPRVVLGPGPAHGLLRHEVALWLGCDSTAVVLGHRCPRCGGDDHGRPLVLAPANRLHVSVSRAADLVAVALTEAGPLGVDVESTAATGFAGFDDVVLHPDESSPSPGQRARIWVRKEAVLKAVGWGLRLDPRRLRVSAADQPAAVLGWEGLEAPDEVPRIGLLDVEAGPHHRAAVAVCLSRAASAVAG